MKRGSRKVFVLAWANRIGGISSQVHRTRREAEAARDDYAERFEHPDKAPVKFFINGSFLRAPPGGGEAP